MSSENVGLQSGGRLAKVGVTKPNYVRNSGMWFAQRQAPGTATTYSNTSGRAVSADGFAITNENASAQYQRTDTSAAPETGLLSRYYGNFTKITSTGKLVISQLLEGTDVENLRGRTVRLQVWMKQVVGAAPVVRLGIAQLAAAGTIDTLPATFVSAFNANGTDPTLGTNVAYIAPDAGSADNGTISGNALSCTLSGSWQRFGATFTLPSDFKNLVVMLWGNAQFAATNGFAFAQLSLTDGTQIVDWTPDDIVTEVNRCQRYYWKTFAIDTAPASAVGAGTGEYRWCKIVAGATAGRSPSVPFAVRMRATPTCTSFNPAAAGAQVRDITAGASCTATNPNINTADSSTGLVTTGAAGTAAENILAVHLTAEDPNGF